jgi:DNA mismatch endonuclease (patch repair protein)
MPLIRAPLPETSRRMRLVKRQHTAVERQLAAALRKCGLRFSTHRLICNCRPDIVFPSQRLIVFVDGDFWHGRILIERGRRALVQTFKEDIRGFWVAKIVRNVDRDRRQCRILRRSGWSVLRLWEKDVLRNPSKAAVLIHRRVNRRRCQLKRRLDAA